MSLATAATPKWIFGITFFALTLAIPAQSWAFGKSPPSQPGPPAQEELVPDAPDFEIPNALGNPVRLSDFRGKMVVLELATTWCPTCTEQTEELLARKDFFEDRDIAVLLVFVQDSPKMIRDYLKTHKRLDPERVLHDDGSVLRAYKVRTVPRLLILDREGRVLRDGEGMTGYEIVRFIETMEKIDEQ